MANRPHRKALAVLSVLALATGLFATPAGADRAATTAARSGDHGWTARCGGQPGPGAGWYRLRAYHVRCARARRIAHEWTWEGNRDRVGRFRCSARQVGYEVSRVDCRRNVDDVHKHIRFLVGA